MVVNGSKKKAKKKKSKATADAPPRRSTLTAEERLRVENMHEILGEVWEPFKTAEGAIRGLESDSTPWLELEFWDSLAEAFSRYYGKAITLQVDTAGLARAQKNAAKSKAVAQSQGATNVTDLGATGAAPSSDSQESMSGGNSVARNALQDGESGLDGAVLPKVSEDDVHVKPKEDHVGMGQGEEEEGKVVLNAGSPKVEMLPMGSLGHLSRGDRLKIIRKTVSREKRVVVLQRLFHLAQAPADEVERLVTSVKELKNNSSPAQIRDVNLLQTWQGVREERAKAWEEATEKVRQSAVTVTDASEDSANDDEAVIAVVDVTVMMEGESNTPAAISEGLNDSAIST